MIQIAVTAPRSPVLTGSGELHAGAVHFRKPFIFQKLNGVQRRVEGRYVVDQRGIIRFRIGQYDRRNSLTIDPIITYASYVGAGELGGSASVVVGKSGDLFVAGTTYAPNFPIVGIPLGKRAGEYPAGHGEKVFVTHLNAEGTAVLYSTYIGGQDRDRLGGVVVDDEGNIYMTGQASSRDFPTVPTAQPAGRTDAFVLKLSSNGSSLIFSRYLGGSSDDTANGIAIDASGSVYVTGGTWSRDFPVVRALQREFGGAPDDFGGSGDAFVTKFGADGAVLYSTFIGGSHYDEGTAIAVGTDGSAYVTGNTCSSDFPLQLPLQSSFGGFDRLVLSRCSSGDAFVSRLSADGLRLLYSTYLGASMSESGISIAVDQDGGAWVAGPTTSPGFPTKNPQQGFINRGVLLHSGDGGAVWTRADAGLSEIPTALAFSTSPPNTLYAGTIDGVLRRRDGRWTPAGSFSAIVTALATEAGTETVYGGTNDGSIWKTSDGGSHWSRSAAGFSRITSITIDPNVPETVYAGAFGGTTGGVWKTSDSGVTWHQISRGLVDSRYSPRPLLGVSQIVADPHAHGTLYALGEGMLFKTTNAGEEWAWTGADNLVTIAVSLSAPHFMHCGLYRRPPTLFTARMPAFPGTTFWVNLFRDHFTVHSSRMSGRIVFSSSLIKVSTVLKTEHGSECQTRLGYQSPLQRVRVLMLGCLYRCVHTMDFLLTSLLTGRV